MTIDRKYQVRFSGIAVPFILNHQGSIGGPAQMIREFTMNGIEACLATKKKTGIVRWSAINVPNYGWKLCCVDTGVGMTQEDMAKYLLVLVTEGEGKTQGSFANFGMGARMSSLIYNKCGVLYESWRDGCKNAVILYADPKDGTYGFKKIKGDHFFYPINEMPEEVRKAGHGTRVTLLGMTKEEETNRGSYERPAALWIHSWLNTRFLCFPKGIEVSANEYKSGGNEQLRTITGQQPMLDVCCDDHGIVSLDETDADALWWIIPSMDSTGSKGRGKLSPKTGTKAHKVIGHVAFVHKNELYGLRDRQNGGNARLQDCGIWAGESRVIIYIRPRSPKVTTDLNRQQLSLSGGSLVWSTFAEEFSRKHPPELTKFIHSQSRTNCEATDHSSELRRYVGLLNYGAFLADPNGTCFGKVPPQPPQGLVLDKINHSGTSSSSDPDDAFKPKGSRNKLLTEGTSEDGVPARKVNVRGGPIVVWKKAVDLDECNRNRAAVYTKNTNVLSINEDFTAFLAMINLVNVMYDPTESLRVGLETCVRDVWAYNLSELVLVLTQFDREVDDWSETYEGAGAITPEYLTVGVLGLRDKLREIEAAILDKYQRTPPKKISLANLRKFNSTAQGEPGGDTTPPEKDVD
jgi:hypothetical protein